MAMDDPAGIVRLKPLSTAAAPGYANVTSRNRIEVRGRSFEWRLPDVNAPVALITLSSRNTAATGAAAPSSAQLRPPNAMRAVPIAHWMNTIAASKVTMPSAVEAAIDQNTAMFATPTSKRLQMTGFSRRRVALY